MIRFKKPMTAPTVLNDRGTPETRKSCEAHDHGECLPKFKRSIFAHRSVKSALKEAQHSKCAFCESNFSETSYGDVEHFRPKAGFKKSTRGKLKQPGYFWLAYSWKNLLFCCQLCNQRFKQSIFPLVDEDERADPRVRDTTHEDPLLIDPSAIDPALHIKFRGEYAHPIRRSLKGRTTIKILGLNREELVVVRRARLNRLRQLVRLVPLLRQQMNTQPSANIEELFEEVEQELTASVQVDAEYSSMALAYLAAHGYS